MTEQPWKVSGYGISVISRPSSLSAIESWSLWAQIWTPSSTALYSLFHHFGNRAFVSPIFLTLFSHFYIVVLWLSPVQLFGTQWTAACQASLFEFAQTHVHWVDDAIQPSHSLLPPSPPVLNLSQHQGLCIRFPKYWIFSFSINPSNEYLGLISFRIYWFGLLAVQGNLKSLLQHHLLKASVLWCSVFFMVQHLYMTTGKTIALTTQTFVVKVMSLLFNILSRFVIAFLPRSKCLLISWLLSLSIVILEPKKIKSATVSIFSPSIFP